MNKMKKFASMAAAILMTACVAVPTTMSLTASAATEVTLAEPTGLPTSGTNNITGITAYQIFKGTYDSSSKKLNISGWGDGIKVEDFINALKADSTVGTSFTSVSYNSSNPVISARAIADIAGKWSDDDVNAQAFAKLAILNKNGSGTTGNFSSADKVTFGDASTSLNDGYYVVTCTVSNSDAPATHTAQSLGMLSVLGGSASGLSIGTGTAKVGLPEVMKKVYENKKEATDDVAKIGGYTEDKKNWNDVADYCIGDSVPFKLYGTMPQDIGNYNHYYYKFTDTLGKEFTAPTSVTIKVNNVPIEKPVNSDIFTSITTDTDGVTTITVTFEDVKEVIEAVSKRDALPTDVVTIEYNAVLNSKAAIGLPGQENKVDLTYSNNPNVSYKPNGGSGDDTPGTPNTPSTPPETPGEEGKTPEDKVIVFTYEADFTKVDGVTKAPLANVEFKLKRLQEGSTTEYEYVTLNSDGKVTGWDTAGTTITSDSNGQFKIIGLDDGEYKLEETKPLQDYNPIADTTLIISAGTVNNQTWNGTPAEALKSFKYKIGNSAEAETEIKENLTGVKASGTIENKKGSSLPSTGGIGTTLFYVCGGAMVAVSGIFLITKKRMDKNKD